MLITSLARFTVSPCLLQAWPGSQLVHAYYKLGQTSTIGEQYGLWNVRQSPNHKVSAPLPLQSVVMQKAESMAGLTLTGRSDPKDVTLVFRPRKPTGLFNLANMARLTIRFLRGNAQSRSADLGFSLGECFVKAKRR
ncbi:hypothetical protein RRG08_066843 [Elysia crispata]|uniref:Uncharacterized protein n=1 Tax=Elysia crispata TaxID=231223 RepID=A0AAE0XR59_9GAST|nr:hypothetical protein RRG08_066843 [Elysia crispata]